jgi:hypothetical protein
MKTTYTIVNKMTGVTPRFAEPMTKKEMTESIDRFIAMNRYRKVERTFAQKLAFYEKNSFYNVKVSK